MGSWGPGVFSDDLALDVRGAWRDALLEGVEPAAATQEVLQSLEAADSEGAVVFWTALAAAQHETGHLQPTVRDRALALIESGAGLETWDEAGQGAQRRAVLRRLAGRLRGPQPAPKRLRGPRAIDPGVREGDVVRIHAEDGASSAPFVVVELEEKIKGRPQPLLLGLYEPEAAGPLTAEDFARMPYLSDLDFSAFRGDDPPENQGIAHPLLRRVMTRRDERLEDVGEVIARGVRRPGPDPGPQECGDITGWIGLRGDVRARELELCRRVTRQRLDRYGDAPDAWRTERRERVAALGLPDVGDDPREVWRGRIGALERMTLEEAEADPQRVGKLVRERLRLLGIDLPPSTEL